MPRRERSPQVVLCGPWRWPCPGPRRFVYGGEGRDVREGSVWPSGPARRRRGGMSRAEMEQGSALLRALSAARPPPTWAPDLLSREDGAFPDPLCGPSSVFFRPFLHGRGPTRPCPAFSAGGPQSSRGGSAARTAPRAERKAAAAAGLVPPHARTRPAGSGRPSGQRGRAAAGQPPPQGMAGLGASQAGREWRDGARRVARSRALFPAPPRLGVPGGSGGETRVPAHGGEGGAGEQRRPRLSVLPSPQLARSPAFG